MNLNQKIKQLGNKVPDSIIVKGILLIMVWVVVFIPTYFSMFAWWLIAPETEMARIAVGGILIAMAGSFQVLLGVVGAVFSIGIFASDV